MIKLLKKYNIFAQKNFILSVLLCSFFISFEYAIIRPASTSIFISHYTSKAFPYCWILGVPFNLFIVYLYNRSLPALGCLKTFLIFVISIFSINSITGFYIAKIPQLIFFQFIFKDVYILLAFKQVWSLVHSSIDTKKAKFLYGWMFGIGGIGSVIGGMISGFFAIKLQSANLFFFSIPAYALVMFFYNIALKNSTMTHTSLKEEINENNYSPKGFSLIKKSPLLIGILLIVIFMQVSAAFLDYQYNVYLEKNIPVQDLRTQFAGKITSIINLITTSFQFFGGFILINLLGFKKSHLSVPLFLAINSIAFLFFPSFGMATYAFATIKTLDYSFFGIIREMLYIPLKTDEKYRAKAIIDVFAYRSSKAFASFFLILMQIFTRQDNVILLTCIMSMVIYIFWVRIISNLFKNHKKVLQSN